MGIILDENRIFPKSSTSLNPQQMTLPKTLASLTPQHTNDISKTLHSLTPQQLERWRFIKCQIVSISELF